ncbi:hypothetical protein GC173_14920 [bacterium]|nr:hypothetical protein [bacterium]
MNRSDLPEALIDKLEDFEQQYGQTRGKLALAMDLMVDAEVSAGQLRVYCRSGLDARKAHPDLESLQLSIAAVRMLIKDAFRAKEDAQ